MNPAVTTSTHLLDSGVLTTVDIPIALVDGRIFYLKLTAEQAWELAAQLLFVAGQLNPEGVR